MFKSFITTAVFQGQYYHHFNINKETSMLFGDNPKDIIEVEVSVHEDQTPIKPNSEIDSSKPDYWGFWDNDKKLMWHIYPAYFLLDMCFPSGLELVEQRGGGKAYRLNIKQL